MAVDINLLPEEEREKTAKTVLRKKANLVSIAILVTLAFFLIGVLSYWGFLKTRESSINKKIKTHETEIQGMAQVESFFRILKSKGQSIAQIFAKEKNFGETLTNFAQNVPNGVYLTDFSLSDDGKIRTSGLAANSQEFSNFILTLGNKDHGGKFYTQISVDSLAGSADGGLKFGLTITFK